MFRLLVSLTMLFLVVLAPLAAASAQDRPTVTEDPSAPRYLGAMTTEDGVRMHRMRAGHNSGYERLLRAFDARRDDPQDLDAERFDAENPCRVIYVQDRVVRRTSRDGRPVRYVTRRLYHNGANADGSMCAYNRARHPEITEPVSFESLGSCEGCSVMRWLINGVVYRAPDSLRPTTGMLARRELDESRAALVAADASASTLATRAATMNNRMLGHIENPANPGFVTRPQILETLRLNRALWERVSESLAAAPAAARAPAAHPAPSEPRIVTRDRVVYRNNSGTVDWRWLLAVGLGCAILFFLLGRGSAPREIIQKITALPPAMEEELKQMRTLFTDAWNTLFPDQKNPPFSLKVAEAVMGNYVDFYKAWEPDNGQLNSGNLRRVQERAKKAETLASKDQRITALEQTVDAQRQELGERPTALAWQQLQDGFQEMQRERDAEIAKREAADGKLEAVRKLFRPFSQQGRSALTQVARSGNGDGNGAGEDNGESAWDDYDDPARGRRRRGHEQRRRNTLPLHHNPLRTLERVVLDFLQSMNLVLFGKTNGDPPTTDGPKGPTEEGDAEPFADQPTQVRPNPTLRAPGGIAAASVEPIPRPADLPREAASFTGQADMAAPPSPNVPPRADTDGDPSAG